MWVKQEETIKNHWFIRWCPHSYVCWFIIPINYRYNPLINPSYWTYVHKLS